MHGDQGWYHFLPEPYNYNALEIYYLSMKPNDLRRLMPDQGANPAKLSQTGYRDNVQFRRENNWLRYLLGKNPGHPEAALRADFARLRDRVKAMRADKTTPDTRLADDPMKYNPASVSSLIQLMLGGIHPGHRGSILHCRLRYFDPLKRRAGVPADVAALVEKLTDDEVTVTLVNTHQLAPRQLLVQAGGYAEHQFLSVTTAGKTRPVNATTLPIRLAPGAGARLTLKMKRYANSPTLTYPWDRN